MKLKVLIYRNSAEAYNGYKFARALVSKNYNPKLYNKLAKEDYQAFDNVESAEKWARKTIDLIHAYDHTDRKKVTTDFKDYGFWIFDTEKFQKDHWESDKVWAKDYLKRGGPEDVVERHLAPHRGQTDSYVKQLAGPDFTRAFVFRTTKPAIVKKATIKFDPWKTSTLSSNQDKQALKDLKKLKWNANLDPSCSAGPGWVLLHKNKLAVIDHLTKKEGMTLCSALESVKGGANCPSLIDRKILGLDKTYSFILALNDSRYWLITYTYDPKTKFYNRSRTIVGSSLDEIKLKAAIDGLNFSEVYHRSKITSYICPIMSISCYSDPDGKQLDKVNAIVIKTAIDVCKSEVA